MDDSKRLERIEKKIDDTHDHLVSIDITLAEQHVSLRDHIRRTAILEREFAPIKRHVNRVEGALKLLAASTILIAIIEFIKHL